MARRETAKVLAATMLGTVDTNALVPVIALYAQFRGADLFQIGLIVGLYSMVHAPANLLFGRLADQWGRKLPLNLGLLWDAASLFLYSLATTPLLLAFVRVSHGLGGGLVGPSSMSLIADAAPPERKGRAMALYGMSLAFAVLIGFGIAGPVVHRLGYAVLFYILAGGLLVGAAISFRIREPASARRTRRLDVARLVRYLRGPEASAGYAAIFSLYFVLGAFVTLVPLFLQSTLGYGPLEVGLSFFTFAALSLVLHYPAGVLADRYGPGLPALVGLGAIGVAMAFVPLARGIVGLAILMALFGVGHGFVFPTSSTLVTRGASPDQLGVVTGIFYAVLVTGVAVGAPTMAAVAYPADYGTGIWASAWVALLGIGFVGRALLAPTQSPRASGAGVPVKDKDALNP